MNIHDWTLHHRLWFVGIMVAVAIVVVVLTMRLAASWLPWTDPQSRESGPPATTSEESDASSEFTDNQLDASLEYLNALEELGVE